MTDGAPVRPEITGLEGGAALPRRNGELAFDAPWEGRAFGMAVAMHEKGAFAWDEFRDRLVERVAAGGPRYYESWLAAFESLVVARGLVEPGELEARAQEFRDLRRDSIL